MINLTLASLSFLSISTSPLLSLTNVHRKIKLSIYNSHISNSFSNIIFSSTINHQTIISNSCFLRTLTSSIRFINENDELNCFLDKTYEYKPNVPIGGHDFNGVHPVFKQNCGNITITGCQFIECSSSDSDGGAICIIQETYVTIHNTIFDKCSSQSITGGACLIIKGKNEDNINFKDQLTKEIDIQYCCFQNCFGTEQLYGVCIFSASENTRLYYASSVNCPGQKSSRVSGAQFDLQAKEVMSHDVNATGGHSIHCGGIEYRHATSGTFQFQTISYITAMFSVAYSDIDTDNLKLEKSNIHHITLEFQSRGSDPLYSGLIHVRYTNEHSTGNDINIDSFCFVDNTFSTASGDNSRIISKGTFSGQVRDYKVILNNCYYDVEHSSVAFNNAFTNNCHEKINTMNVIDQLDLGECKGKVTAAPLTPSPSFAFSDSFYFTKSDIFSESSYFTKTNDFTHSYMFSSSIYFSASNELPRKDKPAEGSEGGSKNKNTGMIAGIVVGVVAAAVIVALVAFFLIKKKNAMMNDEDVETIDGSTNSVNSANPIYNKDAEDDPFKEDFVNNE